MPEKIRIDIADCSERALEMLAHFLHTDRKIDLKDNLRKDWDMIPPDFEILEQWIEGPISKSREGFFSDVNADVKRSDLVNPKKVATVEDLIKLIWAGIPDANKIQ